MIVKVCYNKYLHKNSELNDRYTKTVDYASVLKVRSALSLSLSYLVKCHRDSTVRTAELNQTDYDERSSWL